MQHYTCAACCVEWSRPTARGRVPKLCPTCREAGRSKRLAACAWCGHIAFIRHDADCCSRQCAMNMRARRSCSVPWNHPVWSTPVPIDHPSRRPETQAPETRECVRCGASFATYQPLARMCSRRCQRKDGKLRRKVRECGSSGEWRWSDFMRIAAKFDYCCAYCGVKPDRLDPDHVIPLAVGGPNTSTNLLPACSACNSDKGKLSLDEWAASRHRRGLPAVTTCWNKSDSRFWHLTHLRLLAAA